MLARTDQCPLLGPASRAKRQRMTHHDDASRWIKLRALAHSAAVSHALAPSEQQHMSIATIALTAIHAGLQPRTSGRLFLLTGELL